MRSISGTIGSPTEPNYCAANAYMENFALSRHAKGLRATEVALGVITEVGYLHEHPQIEAVHTHREFRASKEEEMLQLIDMAIAHSGSDGAAAYDKMMHAHFLAGLEIKAAKSKAMDSNGTAFDIVFKDRRVQVLYISFYEDRPAIHNTSVQERNA
ncbi:hypothetical protein GGR56DRAFT_639432 [Xylariaceae sp. FL0804]|nr:hypothetical protein GGR56DRAFT_639432 [Xylariaceae sp. FL0804]